MSRPITLFTGQWADLALEVVAANAAAWGYDGLELACSGDHFDVAAALEEPGYVAGIKRLLANHGLACWTISNHLVGQCVCDNPIDERHRRILPPRVWGDGDPEGVRRRAAQELIDTARAASKLGVHTVTGFTGSSIWHLLAGFPPVPAEMIAAGFEDFASRFGPIIDVFEDLGVRFALEPHPSEIAYDYWTTERTLAALDHRPGFGLNFDPSHFVWQGLDPDRFLERFAERIYHVHAKDVYTRLDGRNGILASHLPFGDLRRGWDFVSLGHGEVSLERIVRRLNDIGYDGPLSIEWEDSGMDREIGAPQALEYLRSRSFARSNQAFDAAFAPEEER